MHERRLGAPGALTHGRRYADLAHELMRPARLVRGDVRAPYVKRRGVPETAKATAVDELHPAICIGSADELGRLLDDALEPANRRARALIPGGTARHPLRRALNSFARDHSTLRPPPHIQYEKLSAAASSQLKPNT